MNRIVSLGSLLAAFVAVAALVSGSASADGKTGPPVVNPYSPAFSSPYRHGVVPTVSRWSSMHTWELSHPASTNNMSYGGGVSGVGVTTGPPRVYLVFYGSQWGTQGTDGNGNATFSGDPTGMAPYLQKLFKGLGTGGETWSGVMTQYCEGIASGSQTCPSNAAFVAYPTGGALAGVWEDTSVASPSVASQAQLGNEAVSAAGHFGHTTAASNRNTQYVIVSPHGTSPDGFVSAGFCAWHDYTGDTSLTGGPVSSQYGPLAFTNLPYIPDAGGSCGQSFVNGGSAGALDGVSIVEGHEYAETITDQFPAGGWTDSSGEENGDKCIWNSGTGAVSGNLTLTTGTFAMQPTWGNDGGGGTGACEFSHAYQPVPSITCASPDGVWHNSNVSLACTAADTSGTGLANPSDANPGFSLSTSVSQDSETANAATGTYTVCDNAGGCTTAGPISGNKIDRKAPAVTISSPTGAGTASNPAVVTSSPVTVAFSATDGGSGVTGWTLQRYAAPLSGSGCGSFSADGAPLTGTSGGSGTASQALQGATCYSWTLGATDAKANVSSPFTSEVVRLSKLTASPTSLAFGSVRRRSSATLTDTFTNSSGAQLSLTSIAVTGSTFTRSGGTCSTSTPLGIGGSCTVIVKFAPTAARVSYAGTLTVVAGDTVRVALTGRGA